MEIVWKLLILSLKINNFLNLIKKYKINKIETRDKISLKKNGFMIPIWKDYDKIEQIKPRYVYYLTCAPQSIKGPYLHKKRRGLLTLLEGRIVLAYKSGNKFNEVHMEAGDEAMMADIPKMVGYLIQNPYKKEARLLNICDYPWKKDDNETITPDFSGYLRQSQRQNG